MGWLVFYIDLQDCWNARFFGTSFSSIETGKNNFGVGWEKHKGATSAREGQSHCHLQTLQRNQAHLVRDVKSHQGNWKEIPQTRWTHPQQRNPPTIQVADIVSGKRNIQQEELKDLNKYLNEEEIKQVPEQLAAKKIEGYWWKCLNAAAMLKEHMGKDDEQLLKYLEKIHVVDEEGCDNFTIIFSFG